MIASQAFRDTLSEVNKFAEKISTLNSVRGKWPAGSLDMRNPGEAPAHDRRCFAGTNKILQNYEADLLVHFVPVTTGWLPRRRQLRTGWMWPSFVAAGARAIPQTRGQAWKSQSKKTLKCKSIASNNLDSILSIILLKRPNHTQKTAFIKKLDLAATPSGNSPHPIRCLAQGS